MVATAIAQLMQARDDPPAPSSARGLVSRRCPAPRAIDGSDCVAYHFVNRQSPLKLRFARGHIHVR